MTVPTAPLSERVLQGDLRAIARAITLIENEHPTAAALVRAIEAGIVGGAGLEPAL